MPTYEYQCGNCEHKWEEFQSISAKPTKKCPECGRAKAERLISAGGWDHFSRVRFLPDRLPQ